MSFKCFASIVLAASLALSTAVCAADTYQLGAGDKVRITVFKHADMETEIRVSASGTISMPLIGQVELRGLDERAAERLIAKRLSDGGFVREPQVTLSVEEYASRQASVLGFVNQPGKYVIPRGARVVDLIALAGGVSATGDDRVVVTRPDAGDAVEIDLIPIVEAGVQEQNQEITDNDVLYVPPMRKFYIYGAVENPGAYRLERDMTVMQAVSVAGGLYVENRVEGSESGIELHRKRLDGSVAVLRAAMSDKLQPNDVLRIKERLF